MTTLREARQAINSRFVSAWNDVTPYTLQNEDFESEGLDEWARVTINNTLASQGTLGPPTARRFERQGVATVQIFTKGGSATDRADELAMIAQGAFEGVTLTISSVTFLDVVVNEIGEDDEGTWYQVNVVANFRYFETK
ncbi:MAG: hypothetical protein AAFX78_02490 [Cyanobacteria bacterium J06638_20]